MSTAPRACHWCQSTTRELRPYGPGGVDQCFDCMMAVPGRQAEALKNFDALMEATSYLSDVIVLTPDGPRPATASERRIIHSFHEEEETQDGDV